MSKELRAFRKICINSNGYEFTDEYKKNKKLIEKSLKALEIIRDKRTDVGYLMSCDFLCDYNDCDETPYDKPLTQEEFDLLKEVLL